MTELNISLSLTSSPSSPRIPLKISSEMSAIELHDLVSSATSIPKSALKIIFRGRMIPSSEAENVVAKFKLEDGCVVHCMGKPVAASSSTALPPSTAAAATPANTAVAPSTSQFPTIATGTAGVGNQATATTAFTTALQTLKASCANDSSSYTTALKTLQKVIENIAANPMEEKYRKIKCSNAAFSKRLGGLPGGKEALLQCGFDLVTDAEDSAFVIQPSAEKWELLQTAKTVVDAALDQLARESQGSPAQRQPQQSVDRFGGGLGNLSGGMPPIPPGMDMGMMQNLLSDPNALSGMLSV